MLFPHRDIKPGGQVAAALEHQQLPLKPATLMGRLAGRPRFFNGLTPCINPLAALSSHWVLAGILEHGDEGGYGCWVLPLSQAVGHLMAEESRGVLQTCTADGDGCQLACMGGYRWATGQASGAAPRLPSHWRPTFQHGGVSLGPLDVAQGEEHPVALGEGRGRICELSAQRRHHLWVHLTLKHCDMHHGCTGRSWFGTHGLLPVTDGGCSCVFRQPRHLRSKWYMLGMDVA